MKHLNLHKKTEMAALKRTFIIAFTVSIFSSVLGAIMKLNHLESAFAFLTIGIIASITYIIMGIYLVNKSTKLTSSKKVLWTIGFIMFSFFTAIIYLINYKNK
ncbi:hypothetical protein K5I29_02185 [Flavobacterium agricola]|uniref:Uncharacterized protein n=1 Tax=Flavobacterium agricola TaxID=2870839 RepID=A0ABY6M322_9FLAO|nr:hypothetical protein [Flavobacterium agricola]UYW01753.1 hypothetical protein K5I29_02185 [Flavobacterium agricola]